MASRQISLSLDTGPKTVNILVTEKSTVDALYTKVAKLLQAQKGEFELMKTDGPLHKSETIRESGLYHGSIVLFIATVHGGSSRSHGRRLKALPGYIKLTDEPCDVTLDDDEDEKRAEMPCGCVVAADTVKQEVEVRLQKGDCEFKCPNCDEPWNYFLVRHVLAAKMSDAELREIGKQVSINCVQKSELDIRQCAMCKTYCRRDFTKWFSNKNRVTCNRCTAENKGKDVDFCWICGQRWKGDGKGGCGNRQCKKVIEEKLNILATCGVKKIGDVRGCPDTRACPECGMLVSHIDSCKQVRCKCGCPFCFICLGEMDEDGQWECGSFNDFCRVAARQKTLP